MLPGDAPTSPLPLPDRIVIALDQLRVARARGDPTEELAWQTKLDALLDDYPR
ncbi:hypothetical protein [Mycobacterium malmoense]|uniref:hypothetical protein n=1 Tax=Mycobacterium malmoense TaxID=1780 RepID=UPI0015A5A699|nr:hypothetical protein [Mycobacterium malmoense]